MWRVIGRLLLVPLGFLIAGGVAAFVLFTLGAERLVQELHVERMGDAGGIEDLYNLWQQLALIGGLASALTIVPGLIVVIVGEVANIRSAIFYVLGGGAALVSVPLLSQVSGADGVTLPTATILQVFATAGFASGLVYWLIAGRTA